MAGCPCNEPRPAYVAPAVAAPELDSDPAFRIYPRHMRAAKVCVSGSREWCARNGFSWHEFVHDGLRVSVMRALDDAIINRLIAAAEKERRDGR